MTPDSSVIVAAFGSWHIAHAQAIEAIKEADTLVAHAEIEAYSVLTRLPPPHRAPADIAADYLVRQFSGKRVTLSQHSQRRFVSLMAEYGISGGAVYDALIALTAGEHGLTLLTGDTRAMGTYRRIGVQFQNLQHA